MLARYPSPTATMWSADWYIRRSIISRIRRSQRFRIAPTAQIDSGQISRISRTSGIRFSRETSTPAHPQKNCGDVATTTSGPPPTLHAVMDGRAVLAFQRLVERIAVPPYVISYVTRLVRATRPQDIAAPKFVREMVDWGAGPRAGQYLIMGAKAFAAMDARFNVSCEDVRRVAVPVLRHRIAPNFQAQAHGIDSVEIVRRLVDSVPEPEISKAGKTRSAPFIDFCMFLTQKKDMVSVRYNRLGGG